MALPSQLLAFTSPILDMIFGHALTSCALNVDSVPWSENFLSQFFVHNEKIKGFGANPLESACEEIRQDVLEKLHEVAERY